VCERAVWTRENYVFGRKKEANNIHEQQGKSLVEQVVTAVGPREVKWAAPESSYCHSSPAGFFEAVPPFFFSPIPTTFFQNFLIVFFPCSVLDDSTAAAAAGGRVHPTRTPGQNCRDVQ